MIKITVCLCGCGEEIPKKYSKSQKYIRGHKSNPVETKPQMFCSCGCGELTLPGNKFINGHNGRGITLIEKLCPQCDNLFKIESWKKRKFCSFKCSVDYSRKGINYEERECVFCGELFKVEKWRPKKYCSAECIHNAVTGITYESRKCLNCGMYFQIQPFKPNKYCSIACWGLANRRKDKKKKRVHALQNSQGQYIHRVIMEEHLGRKLLPTERVHHIDMNKLNNEIDNLYLFPNESKHQKAHKNLDKVVSFLLKSEVLVFQDGEYVKNGKM